MKRNLLILLSAVMLAAACTGTGNEATIPVYKESELTETTAEITLQYLNEQGYGTEIIHLFKENMQDPLIMADALDVEITDDFIFVLTSDSQVYEFSHDGKLLCMIGTKGNGPGEYLYVNDIFLASNGEDICLSDVMKGVLTYSYDGVYKSTESRHKKGGLQYLYSDGPLMLESVQILTGEEPHKLYITDTRNGEIKSFSNHLLFQYSPKAAVTAYMDYKAFFKLNDEVIYHQQGTDTIFTVQTETLELVPRCSFVLENGAKESDYPNFVDIRENITILYDYAEDTDFRYVTLILPGWKEQLFLINKSDNKIYKSAIKIPDTEESFHPRWQSKESLIDYYITDEDGSYIVILKKK